MNLWHPEAFCREFGHVKHDIVNTKTGKSIPNVPLKIFWDGFENLSARMVDENGLPINFTTGPPIIAKLQFKENMNDVNNNTFYVQIYRNMFSHRT